MSLWCSLIDSHPIAQHGGAIKPSLLVQRMASLNSTIIEMDGIDTLPYSSAAIHLHVAQRYSPLLDLSELDSAIFNQGYLQFFVASDVDCGNPFTGCMPTRTGYFLWDMVSAPSTSVVPLSAAASLVAVQPPMGTDCYSVNALGALPLDTTELAPTRDPTNSISPCRLVPSPIWYQWLRI